jgi:hypothetical protein
LVARCQPAAFAVARRFHPLARLFVYKNVVADVSGRVAQLARSCPGALVFAAGLESCGGLAGEASHSLIDEAVAGRPLARVLSPAVEQFLIHEAVLEEQRPGGARTGRALALIDGSAEDLQRWLDRMRLFVRRAGPRVSPLDLCAPPPSQFAPEDIPGDVRANGRWYAAMRVVGLVIEPDAPPGLWSFASRNALLLYDEARAQADEPWLAWGSRSAGLTLARRLLAHARAIGRWPTRYTNAKELVASMHSWRLLQDSLTRPAQRLGELLEHLRKLDLGEVEAIHVLGEDHASAQGAGIVFPVFEAPVVEVAGVELAPIRTALELAAEGRRMDNCVAGLCGELARGGRWIFSGRIQGEPVTVEIAKLGGRYALGQARGYMNCGLSAGAWTLLGRWLRALDAQDVGRSLVPRSPAHVAA